MPEMEGGSIETGGIFLFARSGKVEEEDQEEEEGHTPILSRKSGEYYPPEKERNSAFAHCSSSDICLKNIIGHNLLETKSRGKN